MTRPRILLLGRAGLARGWPICRLRVALMGLGAFVMVPPRTERSPIPNPEPPKPYQTLFGRLRCQKKKLNT